MKNKIYLLGPLLGICNVLLSSFAFYKVLVYLIAFTFMQNKFNLHPVSNSEYILICAIVPSAVFCTVYKIIGTILNYLFAKINTKFHPNLEFEKNYNLTHKFF